MDVSVILFLIFSFGALIIGFILEGGHLLALFIGTAALIVFGGTVGAVGLSFPVEDIKRIPKIIRVLLRYTPIDNYKITTQFFQLTSLARAEGILSLEKSASNIGITNPLASKGLRLIVDGVETNSVYKSLVTDAENIDARHEIGIAIFETAGGYAPTMGIIGTVMGLVHVLGNLSDPSSLGPKIAVAFIATLYGVGTANLLWLPIAARLKNISEKESLSNQMIIKGLIALQQGEHPKLVIEDMCAFLTRDERDKLFKELNLGDN